MMISDSGLLFWGHPVYLVGPMTFNTPFARKFYLHLSYIKDIRSSCAST